MNGSAMDPLKALHNVTDYRSFLLFVRTLANDWEDEVAKEKLQPSDDYGPGANGWENGTIGAYLDAALRSQTDGVSVHEMQDQQPSWRWFAEFLIGGKYYE